MPLAAELRRQTAYKVMIRARDLRATAKAHLKDATILHKAGRHDGAYYLCGYAVELALKARVCKTLKWTDFPETRGEFQKFQSFKTHDLELLLRFSGVEGRIKAKYLAEWSVVLNWDPEKRYQKTGLSTQQEAADMIASAKKLLDAL